MSTEEIILEIQKNLLQNGFDFNFRELKSLGEEKIQDIYKHILNKTFVIFLKIYKTKKDLYNFLKKDIEEKEEKSKIKIEKLSKVFRCPECKYRDPQRFLTGICPNCGAEINKNILKWRGK